MMGNLFSTIVFVWSGLVYKEGRACDEATTTAERKDTTKTNL